ncbi:MAG: hypothetical protein Q9157_004894 [Trypethelium eluteriae]
MDNISHPGRRLLYDSLGDDEFRLLSIDTSLGPQPSDSELISCSLATFKRSEYTGALDGERQETARLWPGFERINYDYSSLFRPKRRLKNYTRLRNYAQTLSHRQIIRPPQLNDHGLRYELKNRYIALSYVWGPPKPAKAVMVNSCEVEVRENLYTALLELRRSDWVRQGIKIWIDTLCINQEDLDEAARQVRSMRDIYMNAWQVVAWLGPPLPSTEVAYAAVLWLARHMETGDRFKDFVQLYKGFLTNFNMWSIRTDPYLLWRPEVFSALRSFFANTYWQRLWILQELGMARIDAPILCGRHCASLQDIFTAAKLISICEREVGSHISTVSGLFGQRQDMVASKDRQFGDDVSTPARQWGRILQIMKMREQKYFATAREHQAAALPAFELARSANTTDERDKVFGILGIFCISQIASITPDYGLGLSETFIAFTRDLIHNNDLTILRLVHHAVGDVTLKWKRFAPPREFIPGKMPLGPNWSVPQFPRGRREVTPPCSHQLPSWVICWVCSPAPLVLLPSQYHADHGLDNLQSSRTGQGATILRVVGVLTDHIATLSAFNDSEADPAYPWNCDDARNLPNSYGDLSGLQEALWRTIVGNSTSSGEQPASASWAALLGSHLWNPRGFNSPRSLGLGFGLGAFMARNKYLVLGGYRLSELIPISATYLLIHGGLIHGGRGPSNQSTSEARFWASNVLAWRRLVGTQNGRVGLAVAAVKEGDAIFVLKGCGMPMVLRPTISGRWTLVGECYVHGIMNGEVLEDLERGRARTMNIEIE